MHSKSCAARDDVLNVLCLTFLVVVTMRRTENRTQKLLLPVPLHPISTLPHNSRTCMLRTGATP